MTPTQPQNAFAPIEDVFYGAVAARMLITALEIDLFSALEAGPLPLAELAARTGTLPHRLEPLLDGLTAQGILTREDVGYAATPAASEYLVPGKPLYQGPAMMLLSHFTDSLQGNLAERLRHEDDARQGSDKGWGMETIMEGTLGHALTGALFRVTRFAAELPGFAAMRTLCDVGGNHGAYTMALLDENSDLTGTILDLPHVVPFTKARCRERGYGERIRAGAFDLRTDDLPQEGFDLIVTSHVLYGVADDLEAVTRRLAAGLRPGGWLISHHFAPGERDAGIEAAHEFMTRLAGYPTHFLSRQSLETAMRAAGLDGFRADAPTPPLGGGLILAGRKRG
ncbi:methyltransferase family protein [Solidesulfovibrio sp. C21]|uniref:methyltransferase family protein n=1 Tax=Solidesulfovibrio sp. C21 TaxID=3398613 RepID=UPI0039FBB69F